LKTILVSGLDRSVTEEELRQLFEEHGKVLGVDLVEGQDFGYVRMVNEAEGREAIDALDGALCRGVALTVGAARTRHQREPAGKASVTEVVND
jgi:RNA recognition motif-containing protein